MDVEEKLTTAAACKLKGSQYFKDGKLKMAIEQYRRVTDYLNDLVDFDEEQEKKADETLLATYLNLAMCHLKLGKSYECIQSADDALGLDPNSVKVQGEDAEIPSNGICCEKRGKVLPKCEPM